MSWLILSLFLGCSASFGQPGAETQKKYDGGDYNGAAGDYSLQIQKQPLNASLHYNLGNAELRAGRLGLAIASYQRAFDILPRDSDIRYNLNFALKRAGEELVAPGVPPPLFTIFYLMSERELAGLHWLACWAVLLLASFFLVRRQRGGLVLTSLILWACFGGWWLARSSLEPSERGVIIRPTAEIRSGPGQNFSVGFTAPEGRRVHILSQSADWLEIGILREGAKGWLPVDAVERIWPARK